MKADTIMKNKIILLLFLLFPVIIFAQTLQDYTVKSKFVYGNILKHTIHLNNLEKSPCHSSRIRHGMASHTFDLHLQYRQ